MARQLDKKQKGELADFLDRLYQLGGYGTQSAWAAEAHVHTVNLSNALNRKNLKGIDGYSLLSLLRAVSARIAAEPADVAMQAATPRGATPAALAARMDEALVNQRSLWPVVNTLKDAVEQIRLTLETLTADVRALADDPPPLEQELRSGSERR